MAQKIGPGIKLWLERSRQDAQDFSGFRTSKRVMNLANSVNRVTKAGGPVRVAGPWLRLGYGRRRRAC